ncbi:MAG: hypothetical protein ACI83I_002050 [Bacteroidia bacterium]|jgi:hypothetical protein
MRTTFISTVLIVGVFTTLYFKPFSKSEIVILDHMTENSVGKLNQVCLVQNPPRNSESLYKMIVEFNRANATNNGLYKRLFIKEHDYELPIFPFPHNIDYKSKTATRNDLDNVDFLGDTYVSLDFNGDTMRRTNVYTGKMYYYNK